MNVTHHQDAFEAEFGRQRDLFRNMCLDMIDLGIEIPLDHQVMDGIMQTPPRRAG